MSEADPNEVKPAPRGFFPTVVALGPGIVLAGGVVGSGELINTPLQAANFGFLLLWAVIISCLIKYCLQVEIGRHCIVHDRSVFEAMNFTPGPKFGGTSWLIWCFMAAWTIAQVGSAGIIGAIAGVMQGLLPLTNWVGGDVEVAAVRSVQLWAFVIFLLAVALMWKGAYDHFEKMVVILVITFSVIALVGLGMLQGTDYRITGADMASGFTFSLGSDTRAAAFAVIALMGGLGVSGIELLIYPYWIREKGYSRFLGQPESKGWEERARGWIRIMKIDAAAATLTATVITAAFFLLGAAILHREGIEPKGIGVVNQISEIFTGTYGNWSRGLFLFGAFCTLYSTLLHGIGANGRIYTDFFCSLGIVDRTNSKSVNISHRIMQNVFLVGVLSIYLLMPKSPEKLVLLSHYLIGLVGTPIAIVAILFLAFKTDSRVRMNRITSMIFVLSVGVILFCVGIGFAYQRGWIK